MSLARLTAETRGTVVLACLGGELDTSNVPRVTAELTASVANSCTGLVLDLSELSYLDSTGIGMLYTLARQLRDRHQTLELIVPETAPIGRLLTLSGVGAVAGIHPDREAALPPR